MVEVKMTIHGSSNVKDPYNSHIWDNFFHYYLFFQNLKTVNRFYLQIVGEDSAIVTELVSKQRRRDINVTSFFSFSMALAPTIEVRTIKIYVC